MEKEEWSISPESNQLTKPNSKDLSKYSIIEILLIILLSTIGGLFGGLMAWCYLNILI